MNRRTGVLELAVLGLLHESPLHGYELRKRLNVAARPVPRVLLRHALSLPQDAGRPALDRRGRAGRGRRRRRHCPAARGKIVYQLTADGKEHFQELLVRLRAGRLGGRELRRALRLLRADRRRDPAAHPRGPAHPAGGASRAACAPRSPAPASASTSYTLELQRHGLESVEREVRWLNELIDSERHDRATGASTPPHRTRHHREGVARMSSVRVAIVGVGNCAASLVQGVEYYRDADPAITRARPDARAVRRLPRPGPRVRRRIRRRREEGRSTCPRPSAPARTTPSRSRTSRRPASTVQRGHTYDGLGKYYRETINESDEEPVDIVAALRETAGRRPRLLPARRFRGRGEVLRAVRDRRRGRVRQRTAGLHRRHAGVGRKFEEAGVPIVGDDIKSQVGATITHRVLAKLFEDRGVSSTARCSSTSAATWTSRTCSSATAWSPRRSPRRRPSPRRSRARPGQEATSTSARPTTWPGSTTASGRTSASRAARSATSR